MKSSYSVAAFLGGIIVGGIAALLLAPKAGKELREDISSFAEEEAQKVKDVYNHFRQEETEPSNEA